MAGLAGVQPTKAGMSGPVHASNCIFYEISGTLATDESDLVQSLFVKLQALITGTEVSNMTHLRVVFVKLGQVIESATGIEHLKY